MSDFTISVQDLRRSDRVYSLSVRWWTSIKDIKDKLHMISIPSAIHLFCDARPTELRNNVTLHDLGIESDGAVFKMAIDKVRSGNDANFDLSVVPDIILDKKCTDLLEMVRLGLERNRVPKKTDMMDSSSGVYFMCNVRGQKVAVFKPQDEEQGMPHNPKGYAGNGDHGLRSHFVPGQGYVREFIAYTMDVDNFCQVPHTTLVNCEHPIYCYSRRNNANLAVSIHSHSPSRSGSGQDLSNSSKVYPKVGSLQHFVRSSETFEDLGYSKLTDFEVQKIALLDMRILNCDRNAANILAIMQQPVSPMPNLGHLQTIHSQENMSFDQMGSCIGSDGLEDRGEYNAVDCGCGSGGGANCFEDEELDALFGRSDSNFGDILAMDRSMTRDDGREMMREFPSDSSMQRHGSNDSTTDSSNLEEDIKYRHATATGQGSFDIHTAVGYTLVPIDHGYCFPSDLEVADIDWAWFDYPHVARPVHPEIKKYIASLDIDKLLTTITNQVYVSPNCLFLIRVVHKLIQDGVARGLTLKDIALIIARLDFDSKSKLEVVLENAEENALRTIEARGEGQRCAAQVRGKWTAAESPHSYAAAVTAVPTATSGAVYKLNSDENSVTLSCADSAGDNTSTKNMGVASTETLTIQLPESSPATSPEDVCTSDSSSSSSDDDTSDDTSSDSDTETEDNTRQQVQCERMRSIDSAAPSPRHHRPSTADVRPQYIRRQPSFVRENSPSSAELKSHSASRMYRQHSSSSVAASPSISASNSVDIFSSNCDDDTGVFLSHPSAGMVGTGSNSGTVSNSRCASADVQFVDIEGDQLDNSYNDSFSFNASSGSMALGSMLTVIEETEQAEGLDPTPTEAIDSVDVDVDIEIDMQVGTSVTEYENEAKSDVRRDLSSSTVPVVVVGGGALTRQTALTVSTTTSTITATTSNRGSKHNTPAVSPRAFGMNHSNTELTPNSCPGSAKKGGRTHYHPFNLASKRLTSFDPSSLSLPSKSFFNATPCEVEPQSLAVNGSLAKECGAGGGRVTKSGGLGTSTLAQDCGALDCAPALHRVVSFAGFNSDPLYDLNNKGLYGLIQIPPGTPGSINNPLRRQQSGGDMSESGDSEVSSKISFGSGMAGSKGGASKYGARGQERNFWKKMLKERRRSIMDTPAFEQLRYSLAYEAVSTLIGRCLREKQQ